jgi:nucleoid-associated protein YgaU
VSENWGRIFGGFAALAVLWILVYWWWEPSGPRISFDPGSSAATPGSGPVEPPIRDPHAALPVNPPTNPPRRTEEPRHPEATPPKPAVIPPEFRVYTVKSGDTLSSIAARELGSSKLAEAISRANPFVDFEQLKPGRTINIPLDPKNIQGKPVADAPAPAQPPERAVEYTVSSGDTLSEIAKAQYGSTVYKDLIFEANRDTLESEDALKVGQKLRLPPKPKS